MIVVYSHYFISGFTKSDDFLVLAVLPQLLGEKFSRKEMFPLTNVWLPPNRAKHGHRSRKGGIDAYFIPLSISLENSHEAEEMAPLVRCFLCMREDLNVSPRTNPGNKYVWWWLRVTQSWGDGGRQSLESLLPSLGVVQVSKRLCPKVDAA